MFYNVTRVFLLWLLLVSPAFAQQQASTESTTQSKTRKSEIRLGAMWAAGPAADAVYSNNYKIPMILGANLGYIYQNQLMRHRISLQGGAGWLLSPYQTAGKVFGQSYEQQVDLPIEVLLRYSLVFVLWQNQYFDFRLGPGLHFSVNGWIPTNSAVLRYAWLAHLGLGLKIFWGLRPHPKHRLSLGLYLALLNVGWRAPYQGYNLRVETMLETKGMLAAMFDSPQFFFAPQPSEFELEHRLAIPTGSFFRTAGRIPRKSCIYAGHQKKIGVTKLCCIGRIVSLLSILLFSQPYS